MEFHKFTKKSIAIFAVFALVLFCLVVNNFSPMMNLIVLVVGAILVMGVVTHIEEKKKNTIRLGCL